MFRKYPAFREKRLCPKLTPSSDGSDEHVDHEAKAKVNQHAQVESRGTVPRDHGQRWDQREIHNIAQNHGQQGLLKIDKH